MTLGLASGLGAGIGAVASYKVADALVGKSPRLPDGRLFRWIGRNVDDRPRATAFAIFLVGVSPLPDGAVVVPLAVVHYGMRRLAVPLFLGKLAHNLLLRAALLRLRLVVGRARLPEGQHRARGAGRRPLHGARRVPRREGPQRALRAAGAADEPELARRSPGLIRRSV